MPKTNTKNIRLQTGLAIAAFTVGTLIGCISLFIVPPPNDISNSALVLTSDFLVLCAAMLGVNVVFDYKLSKFKATIKDSLESSEQDDDEQDEKEK